MKVQSWQVRPTVHLIHWCAEATIAWWKLVVDEPSVEAGRIIIVWINTSILTRTFIFIGRDVLACIAVLTHIFISLACIIHGSIHAHTFVVHASISVPAPSSSTSVLSRVVRTHTSFIFLFIFL